MDLLQRLAVDQRASPPVQDRGLVDVRGDEEPGLVRVDGLRLNLENLFWVYQVTSRTLLYYYILPSMPVCH